MPNKQGAKLQSAAALYRVCSGFLSHVLFECIVSDFFEMLHVCFTCDARVWPDMNESCAEAYSCTAVPLFPCGTGAAFLFIYLFIYLVF